MYKEYCNWAYDLRVTFLCWLFSHLLQTFYNDVKLISVVMKRNWFHFNCQALPALTPSVFTRYRTSRWMAWGWFSLAWLEYSHYGGLACSVGLVYHGLHYSSPGINKPVTKKVEQIVIPKTTTKQNGGLGEGTVEEEKLNHSESWARSWQNGSLPCSLCSSACCKTCHPRDLLVHRLGVSELIYVCLFYHSWTLPFHLFMGELEEFSGNNTS